MSMTDDLMDRACGLARALVTTKLAAPNSLPPWEKDELIQEFTAHLLSEIRRAYHPEQSTIGTYAYMVFDYWNRERIKRWKQRREIPVNPLRGGRDEEVTLEWLAGWYGPAAVPDHDFSDRALGLLEMVPEQGRALVATHIAYGASLTATAEIHGVTDRTVSRWVKRAKEVWREEAA